MASSALEGLLRSRALTQQEQTGELQQAQGLMGILGAVQQQQQRATAMQEQVQMKGMLSEAARASGGDPAKMVPLLLQTGHPLGIKLAEGMKGLLPKPAEPYTLGPEQIRMGPDNQPIAVGIGREPAAPKPPTMRTRIQGEKQIQEEFQPDGTWKEVGQGPRFARQIAPAAGPTLHSQGDLDPDAVKDLAIQSLYDPNSLSGYRRDPKMMAKIANERVKMMKDAGVTSEDVVSGRAGFKADTASLNKITPQYDAITAFEKTAIRNGKILIELADKIDTTGTPVLERWIRAGRTAVVGDPEVAKFNAQMNLYRAEAARILTQPNLSGVLTDTARKEMEEVIRNSASASQVRGVVNLLERDFGNRRETLEEQIASIRARMRSRASPRGADAVAAPAAASAAAPTAIPEFATEADALKAGVKGKVKIGGRNATIE